MDSINLVGCQPAAEPQCIFWRHPIDGSPRRCLAQPAGKQIYATQLKPDATSVHAQPSLIRQVVAVVCRPTGSRVRTCPSLGLHVMGSFTSIIKYTLLAILPPRVSLDTQENRQTVICNTSQSGLQNVASVTDRREGQAIPPPLHFRA